MIIFPEKTIKKIPSKYHWILEKSGPKIMLEAIRHYGLMEYPGSTSNPALMKWNIELGGAHIMTNDSIPWCGVFPAICAKRTGWGYPEKYYRAKAWLDWGNIQHVAMWSDILIFDRPGGGGHVGFYWAEDNGFYLVYGGNQANKIKASWFEKSRCIGIRRCPWENEQPSDVKQIFVSKKSSEMISINEQ